jgi:thymidylate synthase (FAD)
MIYRSDIDVKVIDVMGNDQYVIGAMKTLPGVPTPILEGKLSDRGRIRYLMEHRHGTPFEHNSIILIVSAPIFVWREWHRHRIGFSYNEESARYKQLDPVFFIPRRDRKMVKPPGDWKPGRPKFETLDEEAQRVESANHGSGTDFVDICKKLADDKYQDIINDMKHGYAFEYSRYERQLARNLDPGLARDNLPVGIYSTCWVTCNLRSALAFLSLRTHEPAAKFVSYPLAEIEEGARCLEKVVAERFPLCYEAFGDFGRVGP